MMSTRASLIIPRAISVRMLDTSPTSFSTLEVSIFSHSMGVSIASIATGDDDTDMIVESARVNTGVVIVVHHRTDPPSATRTRPIH